MPWHPDVYHLFEKERAAPFEDLIKLVEVRDGLQVIDLGCGTGELTARLAEMLPNSDVTGIDNSSEMLARAAAFMRPSLRFEAGSIEAVTGQWDLVFSNAAIQWVENHEVLIPQLLSLVRPGGQLIVQLPSNHNYFTHSVISEIASEEPYRTALAGWTRTFPVLPVDQYAELLYAHGGRELTVFEKVYPHVLEDADAVANWTRGTTLVPYFERLPQALHTPFMDRYRERLHEHWSGSPAFYPFRRILFAATRM
ncbi:MAG: methyltransferase domain-containing protein [Chloroflexota bacterium]